VKIERVELRVTNARRLGLLRRSALAIFFKKNENEGKCEENLFTQISGAKIDKLVDNPRDAVKF
jgi:hypothetical protein